MKPTLSPRHLLLFTLMILFWSGPALVSAEGPAVVTMKTVKKGEYQLLVDGEPFYIKGAGWNRHMEDVGPLGGNVIRTWSTDNLGAVLDEAEKNGLMVIAGLWIPHERHGFDYSNSGAVSKSMNEFRSAVMKYKDHPALLMWGVGNEYNISWKSQRVWTFVNDVSKMIHEVDGNHPVVSVLSGAEPKEVALLIKHCPAVDIYGLNGYGGLEYYLNNLKKSGWSKPYIVTEWGPVGHWEVKRTTWDAPVEPSSGAKYYQFEAHWALFSEDPACLGSCIFFWGWKQERTHTWFGLYLPDGRPLETRESISGLWTGHYPANRAAQVETIEAEGFGTGEVVVKKGQKVDFTVIAYDEEGDPLRYFWEIYPESGATSGGGDFEDSLPSIKGMLTGETGGETVTVKPDRTGAYRLFVYVSDGNGTWGTANVPFLVK
jgi:hypothetical protein